MHSYPENLQLARSQYEDQHKCRMVYFFDVNAWRKASEKHPEDYEVFCRKMDAALLQQLVSDYFDAIKLFVIKKQIPPVAEATIALQSLKDIHTALRHDECVRPEPFKDVQPYSNELLVLAAQITISALMVLFPPSAATEEVGQLYWLVNRIAGKIETTYQVHQFNDL